MHEVWIFLLTFFTAQSARTWYPPDEVNPNLEAFPCEANDFSFHEKHLAEWLSDGFLRDLSQKQKAAITLALSSLKQYKNLAIIDLL